MIRATSSTAPAEAFDVGASEFGREPMPPAEHVQRQISVTIVAQDLGMRPVKAALRER
jgi:hypothetical protein